MKINKIIYALFIVLLTGCFSDKGNYDYAEIVGYELQNVPDEISLLADVESIKIEPKIISEKEGEIKEGNENYQFNYYLAYKAPGEDDIWTDLNPENNMNVDCLAKFPPAQYLLWFHVKDKRTGVNVISKKITLKITSSIYEGWMVLCDEGESKRCRLDMISVISKDRIEVAYDLMSNRGLPEDCTNSYGIGWYPNYFSGGKDQIYLLCSKDAYMIDRTTFSTSATSVISYIDYLKPDSHIPRIYSFCGEFANVIVSTDGDAYVQTLGSAGPVFAYPLNTDKFMGAPKYKVAPFVGANKMMPIPTGAATIIFYNITDKCFMAWNESTLGGNQLFKLNNPSDSEPLFDYNTGKEIIHMEGTRFNNGTAFAVMKDANNAISVYGIGLATKNPEQQYYNEIDTEGIRDAKLFAFHSQFPFMYYASGNKVYSYNLQTKSLNTVLELDNGEEVTCMKFNLFENYPQYYSDTSDEFVAQQYDLIVATFNKSKDAVNGGRIRFFKVNNSDNTLTLKPNSDYNGFAKIVDIRYRERRNKWNG